MVATAFLIINYDNKQFISSDPWSQPCKDIFKSYSLTFFVSQTVIQMRTIFYLLQNVLSFSSGHRKSSKHCNQLLMIYLLTSIGKLDHFTNEKKFASYKTFCLFAQVAKNPIGERLVNSFFPTKYHENGLINQVPML